MKTLLALALLATGLLLFGCTYSANYNYNATMNGSTAQGANPPAAQPPSQGTQGQNPVGANTSNNPVPGETSNPSASNGSTAPSGAPTDLGGKTYKELLLSGYASKCTTSIKTDKAVMDLVVYFDGNGKMRIDEPSTGLGGCPSAATVYKGDLATGGTLYTTCPGHTEFIGTDFKTDTPCAWRSMNVSAEFGGVGSSSQGFGTENETYSSPPLDMAGEYSCQGWTADSSKFDVQGFVCD